MPSGGEIPVDFPVGVLAHAMGGKGPSAGRVLHDGDPSFAAQAAEHTGYDAVVGFQGVYFPRFGGDAFFSHELTSFLSRLRGAFSL